MISAEQKAKQIGTWFKLCARLTRELLSKNSKQSYPQRCTATLYAPLIYRAMTTGKPYPVRGCITYQSNPMVTQLNTKLVYKAPKSLGMDVVVKFWMTLSADITDYVLPGDG